ncbi:MAG: histidine phosphatase family protein [Chloroflexota bacterium]
MKTLLVMRHAKSSWSNSYLSDHERPLNDRGKRDAPAMGVLLKREACVPQAIISSTAKRAMATAEQVALSCGFEDDIEYDSNFYLAAPETYIVKCRSLHDDIDIAMVVGHNPGMEALVEDLTDKSKIFTTANIAQIQLPIQSWSDLNSDTAGELLNLWRPKEIY